MTHFAVILVLAFTAMSASGTTRAPWIAQLAALVDAPDEVLIAWDRQPTWRPVVETASPLEIEGRDVRAAQIAYNLLGTWLETRGPEMFRPLASGPLVALLVLTALGLALAALLAALHRARLERAVEVERVRTRIAADLHDELGAGLSRISLLAEVARRESAGRRAAEPMAQVGEAARRLVGQARDIVWSLNPRFDDLESFLGRVREVAGELLEPAGIAWRLEAPDARAASTIRLRPELRRRLLLLLKESLHNVVCHAGASRVELSIRLAGRRLTGSIADDGRGFDPTSPPRASASGLASMRERLEELGGELEIDAAPGRGTRISFAVPL